MYETQKTFEQREMCDRHFVFSTRGQDKCLSFPKSELCSMATLQILRVLGVFLFCFRRLTDTIPGKGLCTKGIFSYTHTLKMTRLKTHAVICGV